MLTILHMQFMTTLQDDSNLMTSPLVFVETAGQIDLVLMHFGAEQQISFVSVTPDADEYLSRLGLARTRIDDYQTLEQLNQLGDENIKRVEEFCDLADQWLESTTRIIDGGDVVSFKAFFHPMKGLVDILAARTAAILQAIERLRPTTIYFFQRPAYPFYGLELLDKPCWGMTSAIVPQIVESLGIPAVSVFDNEPFPKPHDYTSPSGNRIVNNPSDDTQIGSTRPILLHALFSDVGDSILIGWNQAGGRTEFIYDYFSRFADSHDIDPCIMSLARAFDYIVKDPSLVACFTFQSIPLLPIVTPFLERLVLAGIADLLAYAPSVKRGLQALPSGSIVLLGGIAGRNQLIVRLAVQAGIKTVSHHFGGFLGYSLLPMHERYDMAYVDYFFVGGPSSEITFRNPSIQADWCKRTPRAIPVPTGLPFLDQRILERKAKRKIAEKCRLLYPLSSFPGDNRYLGYTYLQDIEYWEFQKRFISTVLQRGDISLTVKPPLSWRYPVLNSPLISWLNDRYEGSYRLLLDTPLEDCLDDTDLVFIDSPSTPLLYLATSNLPFIAYIDRRAFLLTDRAKDCLRKRCYLAEDEQAIISYMQNCFDLASLQGATNNDEFLSEFLANGVDGNSAKRCVEFLINLSNDSQAKQTALDRSS